MSDDYGYSEKRNKGKDKSKRRKLFPYKHGGKWRSREGASDSGVVK